MWRLWMLYDPRKMLVGLTVFLFALAILIHFILLSTDRFNWLEGAAQQTSSVQESLMAPSEPLRLVG